MPLVNAVSISALPKSDYVCTALKAGAKGIWAELPGHDRLPRDRAEIERIAWVLNQMLDNAIKFTLTGGMISRHGSCQVEL